MKECFPVLLGDKTVGEVQLKKEGLFYNLTCNCRPTTSSMYTLWCVNLNEKTQLGILVPEHDCHVLRKHIPARKINVEKVYFCLEMKDTQKNVIIANEYTNVGLSKLDNAFLKKDGTTYKIAFKESFD